MKAIFCGLVLFLFIVVPANANEDADALVKQAVEMLFKQKFKGDTSAPMRLLQEALKQDPENPEALWQIVYLRILNPAGTWRYLHDRGAMLAKAGPFIDAIVKNARERSNEALAHYALARYAALYENDEFALAEIDQALKHKPDSIKFLYQKGKILVEKGTREKDDDLIDRGLAIIEQARRANYRGSDISFDDEDFYYMLALFNSQKVKPDYEKTIGYYQSAIERYPEKNKSMALALAYLSEVYRKKGLCEEAKQNAEKSLAIETTRDGERNLQFAGFCVQMDGFNKEITQSRERSVEEPVNANGIAKATRE